MAKIPDIYGRRQTARTNVPIVRDDSGAILAQGITNTLERREDRIDKFNYARAKNAMLVADIEARKELEDDDDWETFEERYTEKIAAARDDATSMIKHNADRAAFEMEAELALQRGAEAIRGMSRKREVDWGQARLTEVLESAREAALNAEDEETRTALITGVRDSISGALENDYIDEVAAERIKRTWQSDYGEGFVAVQHPARRIELLAKPKGTPAEFIPTDRRAIMLEAARKEQNTLRVRAESQAHADGLVEKYDEDWPTMLEKARAIKDPETRDATVTRLNQRRNELKSLEAAEVAEAYDTAANLIEDGQPVHAVPIRAWEKLSPAQRSAIEVRSRQVAQGIEPVNDDVRYLAWTEKTPSEKVATNMIELRPFLDNAHYNRAVTERENIIMAMNGGIDAQNALSQAMTDSKRVTDALIGSGLFKNKPTATSKNKREMQRWSQIESAILLQMEAESEDLGRKLKPAEKQKVVDDIVLRQVFIDKNWFADDPKRLAIEVTEEERADAFLPIDDIPPVRLTRLKNYAASKGWKPSNSDLERAYAAGVLEMGDAEIDRRLQGD